MTKLLRTINIFLVALAIAAVAGALLYIGRAVNEPAASTRSTLYPARVKSIADMVSLCTLEMYEETGINDTINGKGLFAIQRLRGSIGFDLEKVRVDSTGIDSIRVYLPPEKVELLESTEPDSYRVVDVWNVRYPLLGASLSTAEENTLKKRAAARMRDLAYSRGYVRRARANAVETLGKMYSLLPDVTVTVVDETPEGIR